MYRHLRHDVHLQGGACLALLTAKRLSADDMTNGDNGTSRSASGFQTLNATRIAFAGTSCQDMRPFVRWQLQQWRFRRHRRGLALQGQDLSLPSQVTAAVPRMMAAMMRSVLLLGALGVFVGAEFIGAESSDIQQILAFASRLNKTLGSSASFPKKTKRRMQSSLELPQGCADACAGMQCVFSESMALTQRAEQAGSSGMSSLDAILSVAQDSLGLMCHHSASLTCGYANSACEPFLDAVMAPLISAGIVASPDCMCESCPNYPLVMDSQDELLTAVCPMTATLECMGSQASCAEFMQGSTGALLNSLDTLQTGCVTLGKATDYATSYEYTPSGPSCDPANEETNGVGLLQFNWLAGVSQEHHANTWVQGVIMWLAGLAHGVAAIVREMNMNQGYGVQLAALRAIAAIFDQLEDPQSSEMTSRGACIAAALSAMNAFPENLIVWKTACYTLNSIVQHGLDHVVQKEQLEMCLRAGAKALNVAQSLEHHCYRDEASYLREESVKLIAAVCITCPDFRFSLQEANCKVTLAQAMEAAVDRFPEDDPDKEAEQVEVLVHNLLALAYVSGPEEILVSCLQRWGAKTFLVRACADTVAELVRRNAPMNEELLRGRVHAELTSVAQVHKEDVQIQSCLELAVGFISQPKHLSHQLQNQVPPCFVQSC
eukprot:s689_g50.t3